MIELKWNKSAEKAISQIEARDYTRLARQFAYKGDMLLVGISYSVKGRKHSCKIRKIMI